MLQIHPHYIPSSPPLPHLQCFDAVMWLDVLAAKARCGMWLGGVLPEFTPWEDVFRPRAGAAARRRAAAAAAATAGQRNSSGDESSDDFTGDVILDEDDDGERAAAGGEDGGPVVRLKGLSHPLLMAGYLKERERLQRQLQRLGAEGGVGAGGQQHARRPGQQQKRRLLSNRKENMR